MSLNPENISCHVVCCFGTSCKKHGAEEVYHALKNELKEAGLHKSVHISKSHCNHLCKCAPLVMLYPHGAWYQHLTPKGARKLVRKHILKGKSVKKYLLTYLPKITSLS